MASYRISLSTENDMIKIPSIPLLNFACYLSSDQCYLHPTKYILCTRHISSLEIPENPVLEDKHPVNDFSSQWFIYNRKIDLPPMRWISHHHYGGLFGQSSRASVFVLLTPAGTGRCMSPGCSCTSRGDKRKGSRRIRRHHDTTNRQTTTRNPRCKHTWNL